MGPMPPIFKLAAAPWICGRSLGRMKISISFENVIRFNLA